MEINISITNAVEEYVQRQNVIFYDIEVRNGDRLFHRVKRRYREFKDLHLQVLRNELLRSAWDFEFPSKTFLYSPSVADAATTKRKEHFVAFLNLLLSFRPLPEEIISFLEIENVPGLRDNHPSTANANHSSQDDHRIDRPDAVGQLTGSHAAVVEHPSHLTANKKAAMQGGKGTIAPQQSQTQAPKPPVAKSRSSLSMFNPFASKSAAPKLEVKTLPPLPEEDCTLVTLALASASACLYVVFQILKLLVNCCLYFSIGGAIQWTKQFVSRNLAMWRFAWEVVIALLFLHMLLHKFLGYAVGTYLTSLLGTPSGAFQFEFGWIAIRLGMDQNEIVVDNFVWKNPPRFKDTAYFVRVKQLLIRFDLVSIVNAIRFGEPIIIQHFEIDSVDVYIEKGAKGELNLWAALGADNSEDEKSVESSVMKKIARAVTSTASATTDVIGTVAKYNPASVIYRTVKSASGKMGSKGGKPLGKGSESGKSGEGTPGKRASSALQDIHEGDESEEEEEDEEDSSDEDFPRDRVADVDEISRDEVHDIVEDNHDEDAEAEEGEDGEVQHWGVKYKIKTELFTLRKLHVYAQDFLNAEHSKTAKSSSHALKVELMNMVESELTDKPKKGQRHRQGVYVDDLVWRLIAKLISELLACNKVALSTILASAAANQTSAAVIGTVSSVARGVTEELYTFNPKTLFSGASYLGSKVIHSMDAKLEVHCTEAVQKLHVSKLEVRLRSARGLVIDGVPVSTCFALLSLTNQSFNMERSKSGVRTCNSDGIFSWEEQFSLGPVESLTAVLNLKLFQPNMLSKNKCICELKIPLDVGSTFDATSGVSSVVVETAAASPLTKSGSQNSLPSSPSAASASAKSSKKLAAPAPVPELDAAVLIGVRTEVVKWHQVSLGANGDKGEIRLGLSLK